MLSTDRLKLALQSYGTLERLCIIRNPHGATKGYAIVEFSLPSQAKNAYNSIMHDSMVRILSILCTVSVHTSIPAATN